MRSIGRIVAAGREDELPLTGHVLTVLKLSRREAKIRVSGQDVKIHQGDVVEFPQRFESIVVDNRDNTLDLKIELAGGGGRIETGLLRGFPSGAPSYSSGASGTVNVPDGAEVTIITAHTSQNGGALTIGGGAVIPIPKDGAFTDAATPWRGPLAIVFANTDAHYVAWTI